MTCRSGSASLTPSAAPAPQPSPAAGLDPKNPPGRVDGQCSGSSVYSLTIVESGSRASRQTGADPDRADRPHFPRLVFELAPAGPHRLAPLGDPLPARCDFRPVGKRRHRLGRVPAAPGAARR